MRISEIEKKIIKDAVHKYDAGAEIYLFGSRADDAKKGGDIDLLVMSEKIDEDGKWDILNHLLNELGEQKIDLTVAKNTEKPFTRIAINQGVLL
jgi:predicted nucleotidyltransferase